MKRLSVRLPKDVFDFIDKYAKVHGIPRTQAAREIFHLFKYIVIVKNGIYILLAITESGVARVPKLSDGEKINISLTDNDIFFLDRVAEILRTNRSVAFRISLSTAIKLLKMLGLIIG